MNYLNQNDLLKDVAKNWKRQYCHAGFWGGLVDGDSEKIYKKLLSAKSIKEVENIIGNKSWTSFTCNECQEYVTSVIRFEDFDICKSCFNNAKKLLINK